MAESSPLFGFDPTATTVAANYGKVAEAQGDIADAVALSKSQDAPFDFLGVGRAAVGMTTEFANQKNKIDAHNAKMKALDFMNKNQHLSGHELSAKLEQEIQGISNGDYSTGYREGALSIFDTGYQQALNLKEEERVTSALNVLQSDFTTVLDSYKKNGLAIDDKFAENYATGAAAEFKVPVAQVRNAMVAGLYQDALIKANAARNATELAAAQKQFAEMASVLKNPLFLDSRSAKFKPVLTALQTQYDGVITAKEKEFKDNYGLALEQNRGDGEDIRSSFLTNPELMKDLYINAYSTPAAAEKAYKEDYKKWQDMEAARKYMDAWNSKQFRPNAVPSKEENPYIWKNVVDRVSSDLVDSLAKGDLRGFITIANTNQEVMKEAGSNFARAFTSSGDNAVLTQFKTAFDGISGLPGGSQALQTTLGDNYQDIMSINILADGYTDGDIVRAKGVYNESMGQVTKATFDSKDQARMAELRGKLGPLGDKFQTVVERLRAINPALAAKQMDDIYDKYNDSLIEVNGTKHDRSAYDTSKGAYEPDVFNTTLGKMLTERNSGTPPAYVTNLPGNIMSVKDGFGFTVDVMDAGPLLEVRNKISAAEADADTKNVTLWTKIGDMWDLTVGEIAHEWDNTSASEVFGTATVEEAAKSRSKRMSNWDSYLQGMGEVWDSQFGPVKSVDPVTGETIVDTSTGKGIFAEGPSISEAAASLEEMKKMYPTTIDPKVIPDYDERKSLEARNAEAIKTIENAINSLKYDNIKYPLDDDAESLIISP